MIPRASWILGNHAPTSSVDLKQGLLRPPSSFPEILGKSSATELHLLQFILSWQLDDFLKCSFKLRVVFLIIS